MSLEIVKLHNSLNLRSMPSPDGIIRAECERCGWLHEHVGDGPCAAEMHLKVCGRAVVYKADEKERQSVELKAMQGSEPAITDADLPAGCWDEKGKP